MPRSLWSCLFVVLASSPLAAQTPTIDHRPVGCVVAKRFPRFEAQFDPGDAVAKARVVFQPENARAWYSVAMAPDGLAYSGVLPQPKKSLKAFRYYIEVVDTGLATRRTSEYLATVVASPADCHGKMMAGGLGSATVLLQVPAGAAVVPVGFEAAGVAAAGSGAATSAAGAAASSGGGMGTGVIVAGAGALAAGAAAAVVVAKGGGDATYQGPFDGQVTFQRLYRPNTGPVQPCFATQTLTGTLTIVLTESSGTLSGTARTSGTSRAAGSTPGPGCESWTAQDRDFNWGDNELQVSGTPGNLTFTGRRVDNTSQGSTTLTLAFSGALSGDVIVGGLTHSMSGSLSTPGSGSSTYSGAATLPVTLR